MEPAPHTATYTIRHGECDPLQHLYTGSYIRLMHEASVAALLSAGCVLKGEKGVWIPALIYLDMNKPLHRGETITIDASPVSGNDTRISYDYTFRRTDGPDPNDVTTTGSIDWQLCQDNPAAGIAAGTTAGTAAPDLLPPDLLPPGSSNLPAPPALSTPPAGKIQHRVPVGWCDINEQQVIHSGRYMDTMVNAAMQAGNTFGWTWERLHDENFVFVAKKQWLAYHASAGLSDELVVTTWLAQVRRSTALRQYRIHRIADGMLLAEGHTLFVTIDTHSGRPVRIPEHFLQDLSPHISTEIG